MECVLLPSFLLWAVQDMHSGNIVVFLQWVGDVNLSTKHFFYFYQKAYCLLVCVFGFKCYKIPSSTCSWDKKDIKKNVCLMRNTIFLTCNFAVSYASMNRKVSLIDLNQNKKKGVYFHYQWNARPVSIG